MSRPEPPRAFFAHVVRRLCKRCKDWKPLLGGTSGPQGKGFWCAECKEPKP